MLVCIYRLETKSVCVHELSGANIVDSFIEFYYLCLLDSLWVL